VTKKLPHFLNNKEESNMATQIRKFEQDAIVESIFDKVTKDKTTRAFDAVKKCKEYRDLLSTANEIKSFDKQIEILKEQRDELSRKVSRSVEHYNSVRDFELAYDRWNGVLSTQTGINEWKLKEQIANRIAISLLPKDAVENIDAIIKKIAKEFK
tara:strand:+ start:168 stop:632 length:465 start_codon:yes stop_codon:yes gene_type:complete